MTVRNTWVNCRIHQSYFYHNIYQILMQNSESQSIPSYSMCIHRLYKGSAHDLDYIKDLPTIFQVYIWSVISRLAKKIILKICPWFSYMYAYFKISKRCSLATKKTHTYIYIYIKDLPTIFLAYIWRFTISVI